MDELWQWVHENKLRAGLLGVGVVMLLIGGWQWLMNVSVGEQVEEIVLDEQSTVEDEMIVVDVAGAVQVPGVYQMKSGDRIGQVLEKAGGFTEVADADWIAKQLNLAEPIKDGDKVYILSTSETKDDGVLGSLTISDSVGLIRINTASKQELESLWGIGEARAESIISNRPYSSFDELKTKAGIPQNVIDRNESVIRF